MKKRNFKFSVWFWFYNLKCDARNIKRKIWNKRIKLWWNRLWIRKDEFHSSLNLDFEAMSVMTAEERVKYHMDLIKRRDLAHRRNT